MQCGEEARSQVHTRTKNHAEGPRWMIQPSCLQSSGSCQVRPKSDSDVEPSCPALPEILTQDIRSRTKQPSFSATTL